MHVYQVRTTFPTHPTEWNELTIQFRERPMARLVGQFLDQISARYMETTEINITPTQFEFGMTPEELWFRGTQMWRLWYWPGSHYDERVHMVSHFRTYKISTDKSDMENFLHVFRSDMIVSGRVIQIQDMVTDEMMACDFSVNLGYWTTVTMPISVEEYIRPFHLEFTS